MTKQNYETNYFPSFTFLHRVLDILVIYHMPKFEPFPMDSFVDIGTSVEVAAVIVLNWTTFPEPVLSMETFVHNFTKTRRIWTFERLQNTFMSCTFPF